MSDANPAPAPAPVVSDRARALRDDEGEPSLRTAWARSTAFTYFVLLAVAALAIGFGWPLVEWAFDARRLFR